MSIVVMVGILLLALVIFGGKEAWLLKTAFGVAALGLIIVTVIAFNRKDDIFLKIPGTRIETDTGEEVSSSGTMYLDSSQSSYIENTFYINDDNFDEMSEWLKDTQKSIYLYIVDGPDGKYMKNLGVYEDGMESTIQTIYNSWKKDGKIPSDAVRYWFLVFYLEV